MTAPKHLAENIGKHVTYNHERKGKRIALDGTIDRAERVSGMTITTDDGRYLACRFRIKPDDGSRAIWTSAFADLEAPLFAKPTEERP